jgi:hypothetical protein
MIMWSTCYTGWLVALRATIIKFKEGRTLAYFAVVYKEFFGNIDTCKYCNTFFLVIRG